MAKCWVGATSMPFCAEKDKRVRLFVDAIVYFRAEPGLGLCCCVGEGWRHFGKVDG